MFENVLRHLKTHMFSRYRILVRSITATNQVIFFTTFMKYNK